MLVDTWIPGFIPELLKAGQIMLSLATGLLLGHVSKKAIVDGDIKQRVLSTKTLYLACAIVGAMIALIGFAPSSPIYLVEAVFIFTVLSGGALAANVKSRFLINNLCCFSFLVLGASCVPSQGVLPDALLVVLVNLFGLFLLVSGAAMLSHWVLFKQTQLWPKISTRVIGAWLLAISLMMLAFQLGNVLM